MAIININIMDKVGNEEFWHPEGTKKEYSHHMYRNSPFESCDSCGNCNGANCEICHVITIPACLSFSVYSDTLYKWVVESGVPDDIAATLVYSDSSRWSDKGYHLIWPT
jgi:hypothetical protein